MKEKLLSNHLLDWKSRFHVETGLTEIDKSMFAFYPSESNKLLTFRIRGKQIEIVGSFHKYFESGTNYQDFSFSDLVFTITDICTKFEINAREAIIHNLEFGLNIRLDGIKTNDILDNLQLYKTKRFDIETFSSYGYLKRVELRQYEVKMYDKGKQNKLDFQLLRIEKKVKKMQCLDFGIVYLDTLLSCNFIANVSEQLLNLWNECILYEKNISLNSLSKPQKTLYSNWNNTNYLKDLIKRNLRKFKHERIKYKELVKAKCKTSAHEQIENQIFCKLIDFEKQVQKKDVPKLPFR